VRVRPAPIPPPEEPAAGRHRHPQFCIERKVDVDKLFTHRWTLDQAEEAYKLFDKQSDGKGVFLI
jgi:threonine dehydrogenase-like Zn-dependent dehydrogenase